MRLREGIFVPREHIETGHGVLERHKQRKASLRARDQLAAQLMKAAAGGRSFTSVRRRLRGETESLTSDTASAGAAFCACISTLECLDRTVGTLLLRVDAMRPHCILQQLWRFAAACQAGTQCARVKASYVRGSPSVPRLRRQWPSCLMLVYVFVILASEPVQAG